MVDNGDSLNYTLKKEFGEEALNQLEMNDQEKEMEENGNLFHLIYKL